MSKQKGLYFIDIQKNHDFGNSKMLQIYGKEKES